MTTTTLGRDVRRFIWGTDDEFLLKIIHTFNFRVLDK